MLEQRIEQHFIDSADLKYQAAQVLSKPIAAAVSAVLATTGDAGKHGRHRRRNGFRQDLRGLVFQVGRVDEVLFDSLLKHGVMIPFVSVVCLPLTGHRKRPCTNAIHRPQARPHQSDMGALGAISTRNDALQTQCVFV